MPVKRLKVTLPYRELIHANLLKFAKSLKLTNFRGDFMRNGLLEGEPRKYECAVVNPDDKNSLGIY